MSIFRARLIKNIYLLSGALQGTMMIGSYWKTLMNKTHALKTILSLGLLCFATGLFATTHAAIKRVDFTLDMQSSAIIEVKEGLLHRTHMIFTEPSKITLKRLIISRLELNYKHVGDTGGYQHLPCSPEPEAVYTHATTVTVTDGVTGPVCIITQP